MMNNINIMSDSSDLSRQQKLAAAKKKLKKYQLGKSPDGLSTSNENLSKEILKGIQNNHIFKTPPLTVSSNKQNELNTSNSNKSKQKTKGPDTDASSYFSPRQNSSPIPAADNCNQQNGTPTGKQTSHHSTGNTTNQHRSHEDLEESLSSYKRSNEQLGNQVNDQRKLILQLRDQLKNTTSSTQHTEQKALKEQLEVHIQTIGILVSEKSELQGSNSSIQKKLASKDVELDEVSNQLNGVQQQCVDLQKAISQYHLTDAQLRQTSKEVVVERDRFSGKLYQTNQEKEELLLQNSELHTKLHAKVEECADFLNQINQLQARNHQGELMLHQLSANGIDVNNLAKWNEEKDELLKTVDDQKEMIKKLVHDKAELLEKCSDTEGHFDIQIEQLKNMINSLECEKLLLIEKCNCLEEKVDDLQSQLSLKAKVADTPEVDRDMKFNLELENATSEKIALEKELEIQINENRRLSRLVFDQNVKIEELESAIKKLTDDSQDKQSLLEQIQADKETISRALTQNKSLKEQLEELEDGFVKVSNNSAELTDRLESEQHGSKDVATKLSVIQLDLVESKLKLDEKILKCKELETQLQYYKDQHNNVKIKMDSKEVDVELLSTELESVKHELELKDGSLSVAMDSSKLVEKLQEELNSAQGAVNQLSHQNLELSEKVEKLETANNKLDGNLYPEREHFSEACEIADSSAAGGEDGKRSFEGLDNESVSDIMDDKEAMMITRAEVDVLESNLHEIEEERNRMAEILEEERNKSHAVFENIENHVQLQVNQSLKQKEREMSEHFYEQTEALQSKCRALTDALEIMRKNEDIGEFDMVSDGITMPSLKTAFMQLQKRYKKAMDNKAQLADRIDHLEHINIQLENETETIGEYITLYQNQRTALKSKFEEKDKIIHQIQSEHSRMQTKVTQLHHLVMQMISDRTGIESKNKQLQELVNRRLALQNGESTSEVPKLEYDLDNLFGQMTVTPYEEVELVKDVIPVHEDMTSDSVDSDQTTQQILQIFEQLETTGEGYQHGWLSPAARKHDFRPCKNCMGPLFSL